MSEFQFTPAQEEAIETACPVLVSAAAGSGKTRVLTERLIRHVRNGEDVTRFLVITFTRAAAAELRSRILAELNALSAQEPGNRHYRRQSALLYRAPIGTIDSFCTSVVRENAHFLGISPGFAMLDEERGAALRSRALEEVLERAYETIGENEGLRSLVDSVGAGRDDGRLAALVLSLYDRLQSRAFPVEWLRDTLKSLDTAELSDAGQTKWGAYLLDEIAGEADFRASRLEHALGVMDEPGNEPLRKAYAEGYAFAAERLRDTARAARDSWDKARSYLTFDFPRLGAVRKFPDEEGKERVKAVWDETKNAVKKLQKLMAGDSASLLSGIRQSRPALEALAELVLALDREYSARKRRADVCDFSDVEHFCVKLLCDESLSLAAELSARFREVMVDEYQDVNAVQELIFQRVSGEGKNLFMVGDVKQSIYRFRLAEPAIFNAKYAAFGEPDTGRRVLLRENFRSRDAVLNACNAVFGRVMSPALGEIEYNDEASLVRGGRFAAEGEVRPELCLLDPMAGDEEETPDKRRMEAAYVAARIRAMVEAGEPVSDGRGGVRPVEYGDIAVLLRTPNTSGAAFRQALTQAGVPVSTRQGGAFFAQPEVSFALSMLAAADNPRQDVPLIAALRGLPFGFTPDELAAVRTAGKGDFWDALCVRAKSDEKCGRFAALLNELRDLAREEPTDSVLRWLYDRTGLMAACAVMPDGVQRSANLMQLYEYARRFEQDGNRGLFRFVDWLRRLEQRGMEPPAAVVRNSVQILSIHKSKGLEFPVVFLADNGHRWKQSGSDPVLCHNGLGLGMRITDAGRGIDFPTLPWLAIRRKAEAEELSEQVRVLYVAMTRARDRLIMTCVQRKAEETLAALDGRSDGPFDPRLLTGASSAAPWLIRAASADDGRTMTLRVVAPEAVIEAAAPPEETAIPEASEESVAALTERLRWVYPHAEAVNLLSKLTATGVTRLGETADPEAASLEPASVRRFRVPEPGRQDAPLTGAERGVAAHLVMQYIDFDKTSGLEEIASEIERLRRDGFLDDRQAEAVPPEDILAFFRSEIGQRVLRADRVVREFRFSLLCPAKTWYPDAPDGEETLLQGVVDCCIEEDGELTILDFKTDAHMEPARYTGQLAAYATAMRRILKKPVRGAVLWYLRKKQAAVVKLPEI
ncbi:MAG: UvrD-helicase domain-containing protein [Oscillospiraceae bacterium]